MKRVALFLLVLTLATNAAAVPVVTAISGTSGTGNILTISGSGFGTKTRSKPWVWADFQDGSTNPNSSLSFQTAWNEVQNKQLDTSSNKRWGVGTSQSTANWGIDNLSTNNTTAFRTDLTHLTHGSKLVISLWRKASVDFYPDRFSPGDGLPSENFKLLRGWASGAGTYSNVWVGIGRNETASQWRFSNERMSPVLNETVSYIGTAYGAPTTTWRLERYFLKYNTSVGSTDGAYSIYINAALAKSDATMRYNSAADPGLGRYFYIQNNYSNTTLPSGEEEWHDSIYVDDSWNIVYLGNAATYAACTQLEVQPYTSWSATTISINQKQGTLSGAKYLYVCDDTLTCNAAGFSLGSVTAAPAPTITLLSPSNGPADGNTTVTLYGTGLVSGAQVTVGGIPAISETVLNSSTMTFVTPAGTSGTNVDVTVFLPDLQAVTLAPGWSYDAVLGVVDTRAEILGWIQP